MDYHILGVPHTSSMPHHVVFQRCHALDNEIRKWYSPSFPVRPRLLWTDEDNKTLKLFNTGLFRISTWKQTGKRIGFPIELDTQSGSFWYTDRKARDLCCPKCMLLVMIVVCQCLPPTYYRHIRRCSVWICIIALAFLPGGGHYQHDLSCSSSLRGRCCSQSIQCVVLLRPKCNKTVHNLLIIKCCYAWFRG